MNRKFETVVGSHLWDSAGPDSDLDVFVGYILPLNDVLLGKVGKSYQTVNEDANKDESIHELGVIAQQLLKGNPNYLIGVLSPKILYDRGDCLRDLKIALEGNIAKNCYNAFVGYGTGHYLKYIESGKDASPRRCAIGVRFFNFGTHLLLTGKPDFSPVTNATPEMVYNKFDALKRAYGQSPLPEKPEFPEKIENWLIEQRLNELNRASLYIF